MVKLKIMKNIKSVKTLLSFLKKNKIEYNINIIKDNCIASTIEFSINTVPCLATIGQGFITSWSYLYYDKLKDKNKRYYVPSLKCIFINTDKSLYDKHIEEYENKLQNLNKKIYTERM